MIKWIYLILLLLSGSISFAQTTAVSATVVDTDGTAWVGGTWKIEFIPAGDQPDKNIYNQNGVPLLPTTMFQNGTLSGSGFFTVTIYTSNTISPSGSSWKLTVCPNASALCGIYNFSTTSTSPLDISSALTAVIPPPRFDAIPLSYGYNDGEARLTIPGSGQYTNVSIPCPRFYVGGVWQCVSSGGGGTVGPGTLGYTAIFKGSTAVGFGNPVYSSQVPGGLLGAMASGLTVITDSGDSTTSIGYNLASPPPGLPNNFMWEDIRRNNQGISEVIQNWGFTRNASFNFVPTAHAINCLTNLPDNTGSASTNIEYCMSAFHVDTGPGLNLGSSAVPAIGSTQSVIDDVGTFALIRNGGGITQTLSFNSIHYGDGDTAGIRGTTTSSGGEVDGSGEGNEATVGGANENVNLFSATIASCSPSCTQGATQLQLTSPSGCTFGANFGSQTPCPMGVGRPFVDITQGPTANTVTGFAAGLSATLEAISLGTPIAAASNAWGTLSGACQPNGADLKHPPFYTSTSCTINVISGTFVANDPTKPLCFGANQYWDVVQVTSVSGSGPVTVGVNLYKPHTNGSVVMQGGPCGSGLELAAETVGTNVYLGYIVGATDTSTLQVTWYKQTGPSNAPFSPALFTSTYLTGNGSVTNISNNGTAVYVTGLSPGSTPFSKQPIIFSGASYGPLNGTQCTGFTYLSSNSGTCTMAGLTGINTGGAATFVISYGAGAGNPISNVNIWPLAHALDTQDETTTPPTINGAVTLMTNQVNWHVGDTVREFNHQALQITGGKFITSAQNMHALTHALVFAVGGLSGIGGGASTTTNSIMSSSNSLADSSCLDGGGLYTCANVWNDSGPYNIFGNVSEAPTNGQDFWRVSPTTAQRTNPAYTYNFLNSLDSGAGSKINIEPFFGDMNLSSRGQLTLAGTGANIHFNSNSDGITFNDRINFVAIAAPTGLACVTGPGAGTLADGTYYYTVGIRTLAGSVIPSTEFPITVASSPANSNSIKCTWNRTAGTNTYQFYGRTTGTEHLITSTSNLFFVDDGSLTPGAAMPTTNTSLGFIDQAAQIGINSFGTTAPTAFEAIIKAPANLSANQTYTLPATGGTLAVSSTVTNIQITTGTTPIAANTCTTNTASAMSGLTTSMAIIPPTPTTTTIGVTGWDGSQPGLRFNYYVAANIFNWSVCNSTVSPITPGGSITWNVGAR